MSTLDFGEVHVYHDCTTENRKNHIPARGREAGMKTTQRRGRRRQERSEKGTGKTNGTRYGNRYNYQCVI